MDEPDVEELNVVDVVLMLEAVIVLDVALLGNVSEAQGLQVAGLPRSSG